ncbi:MBL fold metallo-hydrolase [Haliea sp. E1-2-M8]|uniref:MBL fold metallo-hydrolase n=1 Tax=Haliea sp. E1-2-M8 TaxID=3064706 RepID=UPI002718D9C9|nr:MBL fold metallo-hydrolase [Haliea sp. E1-2-M8]MDO8863374.1 MBL fold metallo-hydrolase [Haliea sp. E1-2-M8]
MLQSSLRIAPAAVAAALLAACALATSAAAQNQEASPTVTTSALTGNLHLLQGRGGNVVASVGEDGVLIIDDDYEEMVPAYEAALTDLVGADANPRFVINTHWHLDHVGGNLFWADRGAVVVAHTNVRERMSTRQEMKIFDSVVEPSPAGALPVITYGDSLALHFNGDDIEVQHHASAHTDGDSAVYFTNENVVHMGDLFFKDGFPFVDLGSGGSVAGYVAAADAVLARVDDSTVIVPGHGSLADKADLQRYRDMLATTSAAVQARLAAGESVDSIVEAGLGEEWESWGAGFINEAKWIGFIANSP